jgi:hypothetical protein
MMVPPKVSRSMIAAQSLGSVKVFAQPETDSFDAITEPRCATRKIVPWRAGARFWRSQTVAAKGMSAHSSREGTTPYRISQTDFNAAVLMSACWSKLCGFVHTEEP